MQTTQYRYSSPLFLVILITCQVCVVGQARKPPVSVSSDARQSKANNITDPAKAKQFYDQGLRYSRLKMYSEATVAFQLAIQLKPNLVDAYFGLGQAYFDTGRWEAAIDAFERGLRLDPDNKKAITRVHALYAKVREQKKTASQESAIKANAKKDVLPAKLIPKTQAEDAAPISPPVTPRVSREQTGASNFKDKTATGPGSTTSTLPNQKLSQQAASPPLKSTTTEVQAGADKPSSPVSEKVAANISNSTDARQPNLEPTRVYRVGVGDILEVRVRDSRLNQSSLFTVTPTGLLEYPGLGQPLSVEGLTAQEISERLKSELIRLALSESPEVLVGVRDYASHTVLISGQVKEPGTKVLRREAIPLYVVLADAQPFPEAERATVISNAKQSTIDLSDPTATGLLIRPGDVIMVQPAPKQYFYIGGAVKIPGEKLFRQSLSLTQAILVAGGVTHKPQETEIELAREGSDGLLRSTRYKLKEINSGKLADPLVQPGDRITVAP